MIKFRIHGRGGQGGVTLAKVLAFMYWTEGKWVQAFGNYSAERTGAPILAFTLVDDEAITNRNKVYYPDHLIIVDPSLLGPNILSGLQPNAFLVIDTPHAPDHFKQFKGHRIATIDAKKIALKHKLGTEATPITNTAIVGALAKVFGLPFAAIEKTIEALHFPAVNVEAAKQAYAAVQIGETNPGEAEVIPVVESTDGVPPLITGNLGTEPRLNVADWKGQEPVYATDRVPPCNFHCPAGNNIQAFIQELAQGNYDGALAKLRESSPLPGSTSRVCPHPCEDFCNRKSVDERINIHELERLAADRGKVKPAPPKVEKQKRVAIIGSGPAGLSAGYHLRMAGYGVTIFEAAAKPGGMLFSGIPEYRLPKEILAQEIQYIQDTGVVIKCNSPIKGKQDLERLQMEFDSVIVAIGLSVGKQIGLKGAESASVMQGIDFLSKVNYGERVDLGSEVIVIGGGNTAIDASRTALRVGAKNVSIVYRRSREEMPAITEEIEAAVQEGVQLKFLHSPAEVLKKGDKQLLKVQKMELGEAGADGRRKPVPIDGAFHEIPFTTLLLATGQSADLDFVKNQEDVKGGLLKVNGFGVTSDPKVFATGDVTTNDGTVTHAIGNGRQVAESVDAFLGGRLPVMEKKDPDKVVSAEQMKLFYFSPKPRDPGKEQKASERVKNFEEVSLGVENLEEAIRCLSCGVCNGCITSGQSKCELFCPERTIHKVSATQLDVDYKGCKGCLICMEVCPRAAIDKRPVKKGAVGE